MYAAVCPKCGGFHASAEGMPDYGLNKDLERLVREVYDGKVNAGEVDHRTANKVAVIITQAVSSGYQQSLNSVGWNTPDWEMIRSLEKSVYQFSFAKCYEQLKATTQALYDADGKVIPFDEFKQVASRIGNTYNITYLQTEYNTAIGSAQMASRYVEFTADADTFPNVTYRTVGDANVRPSHQLLDGVTLPLSDSFWSTWWPPNGWGCRCDIEQSVHAPLSDKTKIITPSDVPGIFKTNMARDGIVFPKDHPYYTHLPKEVTELADKSNPFLYERIHKAKGGGFVYDNPLHNHGKGWADELKTAKVLADSGERVILLPAIPSDSQWQKDLRAQVLPKDVKDGKNPSATLDNGKVLELKVSKNNTSSSIDSILRSSKDHTGIVCIRLTGKINEKEMKQAIKERIGSTDIDEVWILKEGAVKPVKYTRDVIEQF